MNRSGGRFTQRKSIGAYLFTCSKSKTLMSLTAVKATQKRHPSATKVNGKRFSKNYQMGGRFLVNHCQQPWGLSGFVTLSCLSFLGSLSSELSPLSERFLPLNRAELHGRCLKRSREATALR